MPAPARVYPLSRSLRLDEGYTFQVGIGFWELGYEFQTVRWKSGVGAMIFWLTELKKTMNGDTENI